MNANLILIWQIFYYYCYYSYMLKMNMEEKNISLAVLCYVFNDYSFFMGK